jgi:hypothetical protein
MLLLRLLVTSSFSLAVGGAAQAESLRCAGGIASEGDSRLALAYKCGEPLLRDAYCSPVYYRQSLNLVPEAVAVGVVPCLQEEHWLYERGAGNLVATVRLRAGKVHSIVYGRVPR